MSGGYITILLASFILIFRMLIDNIPQKMYTLISKSNVNLFLINQFWEVTICQDDHRLKSLLPLISIKARAYVWQKVTQ